MPVGDVLVGDTGSDIKHDDTALSVDVVSITKTTKLLLTSSIPDIELDWSQVLPAVRKCSQSIASVERVARYLTVAKPRGWTSTPRVAIYFFSNSPVKWRLTNVVCSFLGQRCSLQGSLSTITGKTWKPQMRGITPENPSKRTLLTFPVPPSPTSTSLKVGTSVAIMAVVIWNLKWCEQRFGKDQNSERGVSSGFDRATLAMS